jgi:hypothetical protein
VVIHDPTKILLSLSLCAKVREFETLKLEPFGEVPWQVLRRIKRSTVRTTM